MSLAGLGTPRGVLAVVAAVGAFMLGGGLIAVTVGGIGLLEVIAVPIALGAGVLLLLDPFWPLFLLVVSVPVDALFNRAFDALPVTASTALTLLTIGALLLRMPHEARVARLGPDDPTVRWTVAFALALTVSTLLAEHRDAALNDGGRIGSMLLITLLIIRIVTTPRQVQLLVLGLVAAALFSAAVLIIEVKLDLRLLSRHVAALASDFEGMARSSGASDQNPTTAALMQTAGVAMALALALEYPRQRLLTMTAAGLGILAIILSYARSAALTIAVVALMIAWRHRRSRFFPLGVVLAVIAGLASLPMVPDSYWARIGTLANFNTDYTLWRRLGYNMIGLDLLAQHPLFGIGPGNFPAFYVEPDYRYMPGRTLVPRQLHNMYLGIAAEMGLIGAVAFFGMIASSLLRLWRALPGCTTASQRAVVLALLYGSLAYYIGSLMTPAQYVKYTWLLIGLAAAQARVIAAQAEASAPVIGPAGPVTGADTRGRAEQPAE